MPDITQATRFMSKLTALEKSYLRGVDAYRKETRRVISDILIREGVTRGAVAAMRREVDALKTNIATEARTVSKDVRTTVQNYTRKQVQTAQKAGLVNDTDISGIVAAGASTALDGEESYMTSTSAWLNQLDAALLTIGATLRISEASRDEQIARLLSETTTDGRASAWRLSGNNAALEETRNLWSYAVGLAGAYMALFNLQQEAQFQKQAIATIDERTTDCCLKVHGQIKPLDKPFILTGTPRFANKIQDPPFHWYCRTSETLYHPAYEEFGITTEKMETMAQLELDARELTEKRSTIYPSHATARRKEALPSG